jgi:hypothetical protein
VIGKLMADVLRFVEPVRKINKNWTTAPRGLAYTKTVTAIGCYIYNIPTNSMP